MEDQLELGEGRSSVILKQAWEKSLALLAPEINRPTFESFIKTARPLSMEDDYVVFGASSELAKIFLEKYSDLVKAALEASLGMPVEIKVVVAPTTSEKRHTQKTKAPPKTESVLSPISLPLNEKYMFSTFVVGPSNRLAHGAALAVAQKPGRAYNPLFIYGGPGLGKTHLLQAIGHHVLAEHPGLKIAYVSGETFTYHYVSALREHRSEEFRRKYRSIDIWLVDDIQFLAGKERTKEEFFHTFNALHQASKQVVMSSDRPPKDLNPIEDRLRSRFEAGLVVDIAPPDLETRIAILQERASAENAHVPEDVIQRCAELIQSNIRALEGALVTLLAYSSLMKRPLTPCVAEEILTRYLVNKRYSDITVETVLRQVASAFGIEPADLKGKQRTKEVAVARHVAMYICRELTSYPLAYIGKAIGGRDHSSVLYACNRVRQELESDDSLRQTIEELIQHIKSGECG